MLFLALYLTAIKTQILHEALVDEYCSWTTCDQVIAELGEILPFSRIRTAEGHQDISRVLRNLKEASQQRHLPVFQRCAQHVASSQDGGRYGALHRKGKKGQL